MEDEKISESENLWNLCVDGGLSDNQRAARMLERAETLEQALIQFYEVNNRFGIGGMGMEEYQKANMEAKTALFGENA